MPKYNPQKHHRRSVRLRGYDYSQPGGYFVTLNVRDGECVLGDVVDGQVQLTELGRIACDFWAQVPARFPHVSIDECVVMPNHVHTIIVILDGATTSPPQPGDGRGGAIPPIPASPPPGGGRGGVIPPRDSNAQEGAMRTKRPSAPLRPGGGTYGVIASQPPGDGRSGVIPPRAGNAQEGAITAPLRPNGGVIPPILVSPQPDGGRGGVIPPIPASPQPDGGRGGVIPPIPASPQPGDGRGGFIPPKDGNAQNRPTLGQIVAYYKYETTTLINDLCGNDPMPFWQRSFYDHIVRNQRALEAIRKYIADNPFNWELDQDHPNNMFSARKGSSYGI